MLPEDERTEEMRALEQSLYDSPGALAAEWIRFNMLSEDLVSRVRCVHLSDSSWKTTPIFWRCQAIGEYFERLVREPTADARAALGEELVVTHYDSHLHLGSASGILEKEYIAPVFQALFSEQKARASCKYQGSHPLIILHELKGYPYASKTGEFPQERALLAQVGFLRECGVFFTDARVEVRF